MDTYILIILISIAGYAILNNSITVVNEGYVGVIYELGSLSKNILDPGLHLTIPFISQVYQVQVTIQTDYVRSTPCGTNSGVTIWFDKIEVVNQLSKEHVYQIVKNYTVDYDKTLIFDRITHEMNQFCSKHSLQEVYIDKFDTLDEILMETLQMSLNRYAQGVTIRNVRLSKPTVPQEVENNYKKIVEYQTEILKAKTQQQKDLQLIQTDNEKALKKADAEREQAMSRINLEQQKKLAEIEANKNHELAQTEATREKEIARIKADEQRQIAEINMSLYVNRVTIEKDQEYKKGMIGLQQIDNQLNMLKSRSDTDIKHYEQMKYAEYMNKLLTREYVTIEIARSMMNNAKIYYGDKLPQAFGIGGFFNMSM